MLRLIKDRLTWSKLHNLAEVHHRDAIRNTLHDRHIVRDENPCHARLLLQVHHQIDHLRLN